MVTNGKDFGFNTVSDFDGHIKASIPNYSHIHELIGILASYFIVPGTNVYDLGCSTGLLLRKLSEQYKAEGVKFIGYDIEANLLPVSSEGETVFIRQDITNDSLTFSNTNLILSIFTLQFLPYEKRAKLLSKVFNSLNAGGAFIVAEKTFSESGRIQDIFTFSHYDLKLQSFTAEEVLGKERRLREIMKPLPKAANEDLFKAVGFTIVEQFFQSLNFSGWLCLK